MRKKFWKILGIAVALLVILLLLFVVAFIFNPFEGSLPDMRELVPGNPDYFVRKTDLKDDFTEFPEPKFWAELARSPSWRTLRAGPAVAGLDRDVDLDKVVGELRRVSDEISRATGGFASLVDDVIGQEVIVAGRFSPPRLDATSWCAYLRVTWKVRFAWGLLEWDSIRAKLAEQGTNIELQDDGTMVLGAGSARPIHLARWLDCVMVANDEEFLKQSLAHAQGEQDSFGTFYVYRDGIAAPLEQWEQETGIGANALEFYLRPDQLFQLTKWDDGWPDPRSPDDINQRVLASFLNLSGWKFLSGTMIFEPRASSIDPDSITLLAQIELNPNMHSPFQRDFFRAEPQDRDEWLQPFLTMVPERSCAAAALRMPAGDFLAEMFQAIDPELRQELDRKIAQTGKFQSTRELIDSLRPSLLPRTGFVFHRTREIGGGIETFEPSPSPHVAWVFWIDPRFRQPLVDFYRFMEQWSTALGFEKAYDLPIRGGGGGDAAREFTSRHIPATGEIALMLYSNFLVVSNSGPLIRDMVLSRLEGRNILGVSDYQTFDRELPKRLSGFVFVQGERMAEVVQDHIDFLDSRSSTPEPDWAMSVRPQVERQVLQRAFPSARSVGSLQGAQRERFEELVAEELTARWAGGERDRWSAGRRDGYVQLQALMRTFSSAYLQVSLESSKLQMQSRALIDYR